MAEPQRPPAPVPAGPPSGYNIRPPVVTPPSTSSQGAQSPNAQSPSVQSTTTAPPAIAATPPSSIILVREPVLIGGLTQNGAVIGAAVVLGLLVVFAFLRSAVRNHLIAHKASLASANGASWAFFAFLCVVAVTVVFGLIGSLWTVLSFVVPLGLLTVITLILFVTMFRSATRVTR